MKGVTRSSNTGKWRSMIYANGESVYLGEFNTEAEAIERRKKAEAILDANGHRRTRSDNSSGVTGVSYHRKHRRWRANKDGKHLGSFPTRQEAINARRRADREA